MLLAISTNKRSAIKPAATVGTLSVNTEWFQGRGRQATGPR